MLFKVKNSAFKANIAALASKVVSVIGPLITVPLFIKYLTIEEYGIWLMVLSVTSFFYLSNVGILQVVTNAVAKEISEEKVNYYSQVASSGYYLFLTITVTVLIIFYVFFTAQYYFNLEIFNKGILPLAIIVTCILLTYPLFVYRNVLRGLNYIHLEQSSEIVLGSLIRYAAIIVSLISGFKLITLALIYGITHCFPSFGAKYFLKRLIPKFNMSRKNVDKEIMRSMLKPSASFFILMVSGSLLNSIDNLVIGTIIGAESVPMYAIPMTLILLFQTALGVVSINKMPLMSGLYKNKDFSELRSLYTILLFFSSMAAFIVIVNLVFFGETIIVFWAGPEVFPGNAVFYLMLCFTLLFSFCWPSDSLLSAVEKHAPYANMTIIEATLNIILSIYFTLTYGLIGTISGTIVARLLTNTWFMFYQSLKVLEYKISDFLLWVFRNIFFPIILLSTLILTISYYDLWGQLSIFLQIAILNILIFITLFITSRKNLFKLLDTLIYN
jgi:O-antigen/teichoic acid export membrane protein